MAQRHVALAGQEVKLTPTDLRGVVAWSGGAYDLVAKVAEGGSYKEHITNELVFMLVPHIVRSQELTQLNRRTFDVGTGSGIDLRMASRPAVTAAPRVDRNASRDRARVIVTPVPPRVGVGSRSNRSAANRSKSGGRAQGGTRPLVADGHVAGLRGTRRGEG